MERKIKIPEMKEEDITKWYQTMRPIVYHEGVAVFLRPLNTSEIMCSVYTMFEKTSDFENNVDYSKLSFLADVKMLHVGRTCPILKPTVSEIIRQIPNEFLGKVVAFEIVYEPQGAADFDLFKEELESLLQVSVVRLYQVKDDLNVQSEQVLSYPDKYSTVPIGMKEDQFEKLKELIANRA